MRGGAGRRGAAWAIGLCGAWLLYTLVCGVARSRQDSSVVNVENFGADARGVEDSTQAIQWAIDHCSSTIGCHTVTLGCAKAPCTYASGALWLRSHMVFEVPAGVTLVAMTEPARYPFIYSRFEGTLRFGHAGLLNAGGCLQLKPSVNASDVLYPAYPGDGDMCAVWEHVRNVTLTGKGTIDGQGAWWWDKCFQTQEGVCPDGSNQRQRPSLMKFAWVDGLNISALTLRNSPFWFIHPMFCNNVRVDGITAVAPADSRNTDGFDPDSCSNVHVTNSVFETGDDCIAIKSGRGAGARAMGRATENVLVEDCEFRNGHGVTVGSEMSGGVRNITFRNARVVRTKVAIRIKTARGRGGTISDVTFENFTVSGTPLLVSVDMNYEHHRTAKHTPTVANIAIRHVRAHNVGRLGVVDCLPDSPCTGLELTDIHVDGHPAPFQCAHAYGRETDLIPAAGCLV